MTARVRRGTAGPFAAQAAREFVAANVLLRRAQVTDAVRRFELAFRLEPCIPTLHGVALAALAAQDWRKATGYCRWAAQEDPDNPESWYHLGAAHRGAGHWDKAGAALRNVLELDPAHPGAHAELALLAGFKGDWDAQNAHADRALAVERWDTGTQFNQATLLLWRGEYEQGWRLYEQRFDLPLAVSGFRSRVTLDNAKRWRKAACSAA